MSFHYLTILRRCGSSSNIPRIDLAHQRHKEEKQMFGGVLETQNEKKKRIRKQKKLGLKISSAGADASDSEFFWISQASPKYLKTVSSVLSERNQQKPDCNPLPIHPVQIPQILVSGVTSVPLLAPELLVSPTNTASLLTDEQKRYPSVTRILSQTMSESSKAALERWKQKMIAQLGEEGFNIHNQAQLSFGAKFHEVIRKFLEGDDVNVDQELEAVWASVEKVLPLVTDVQFLEETLVHPKLKYKGVVDCVASYKKTPCVIEWKVSEKLKPQLSATYDAPLQLTAYMGALSYRTTNRVNNGAVVVAYKDGAPAEIFPMNEKLCQRHWNRWLQRVQTYWQSSH